MTHIRTQITIYRFPDGAPPRYVLRDQNEWTEGIAWTLKGARRKARKLLRSRPISESPIRVELIRGPQ